MSGISGTIRGLRSDAQFMGLRENKSINVSSPRGSAKPTPTGFIQAVPFGDSLNMITKPASSGKLGSLGFVIARNSERLRAFGKIVIAHGHHA
jgi:hypothetical protein